MDPGDEYCTPPPRCQRTMLNIHRRTRAGVEWKESRPTSRSRFSSGRKVTLSSRRFFEVVEVGHQLIVRYAEFVAVPLDIRRSAGDRFFQTAQSLRPCHLVAAVSSAAAAAAHHVTLATLGAQRRRHLAVTITILLMMWPVMTVAADSSRRFDARHVVIIVIIVIVVVKRRLR
jgi:hypothetical protein